MFHTSMKRSFWMCGILFSYSAFLFNVRGVCVVSCDLHSQLLFLVVWTRSCFGSVDISLFPSVNFHLIFFLDAMIPSARVSLKGHSAQNLSHMKMNHPILKCRAVVKVASLHFHWECRKLWRLTDPFWLSSVNKTYVHVWFAVFCYMFTEIETYIIRWE